MFDKSGIKKYIGGAAGEACALALATIEEKFPPLSIDMEYDRDECADMMVRVTDHYNRRKLQQTEGIDLQELFANLKRYIYFRRSRKFIDWLSKQPQRNNSERIYSPLTVEAAATCIAKGLSTLPCYTYEEADCFSITDPNEFKGVFDKCYSAAEEYDKLHGHRDYRNGLEFYYAYLKGGAPIVVDPMTKKIHDIIAGYKADFARVNEEERYKWEAIGHYKKHWNIDAENFAEMYTEAFKESSNLLAANMYWPYKMVITFAEQQPEKVRELFKMLYNEELPLAQRYVDFRAAFAEFYKPQELNHYQDLHAISVYLSFEYPDKYYIYKYKVFKDFSSNIGYEMDRSKFQGEVYKLEAFFEMCEMVLAEVKKDDELQKQSAGRLDESCYEDTGLHILTHDVVYFGSRNPLTQDEVSGDWWPSLDEYNPKLSKEDWKKYILEIELPDHPSPMRMLKGMMELGGEASCKRLSQLYGGSVSAYVGCAVNLGKRAKKYFKLSGCLDGDQERVFPIPFFGKKQRRLETISSLLL